MDSSKYISMISQLRQVALHSALQVAGNADDAEDIAQEVMVRMWENCTRLTDDKDLICMYALHAAKNLAVNKLRNDSRLAIISFSTLVGDDEYHELQLPCDTTASSPLEEAEGADVYAHAMNQLPYLWKKMLQMRNEEEMPFADIAKIIGTTESSVRGTLSKARMRLIEIIKQQL